MFPQETAQETARYHGRQMNAIMPKLLKTVLILLVLGAWVGGLEAQTTGGLFPDGTVGVPYVFSFGIDLSELNAILASDPSILFNLDFRVTGGALPPGLTLSIQGISGTPSAPGPYTFTFAEHIKIAVEGEVLVDQDFPIGTYTIRI